MRLLIFFIPILMLANNATAQKKDQASPYLVSIIQGDRVFPLAEFDTIRLERVPFRFHVELMDIDGIFLSASFESYYYLLDPDEVVKDWEYVEGKAMVDNTFNSDQELLIDDEYFNYWFYDPELDWHRFDPILNVERDKISATRTVTQFYDVETKKTLSLNDVDKPLYIFSFHLDHGPRKKADQAANRQKAVIIMK